jgi:hypothetical protein
MGLEKLLPTSDMRLHELKSLSLWQEFRLCFGDTVRFELFALSGLPLLFEAAQRKQVVVG